MANEDKRSDLGHLLLQFWASQPAAAAAARAVKLLLAALFAERLLKPRFVVEITSLLVAVSAAFTPHERVMGQPPHALQPVTLHNTQHCM
jgi:hypothetical protein